MDKTQTLYMREGSADKVYTATLAGKMVTFAWGRRGAGLQSKTVGPLGEAAALKLYNDKLGEKLSKGYKPVTDGDSAAPVVQPTDDRSTLTIPRPMLLNLIGDEELLKLAASPDWFMQEKHDGWRILLEKRGGRLFSYSRTGKSTIALPKCVADAALSVPEDFILDGEIVDDTVFAFDILKGRLEGVFSEPYALRLSVLHSMVGHMKAGIVVVGTATTPDDKLAMFAEVRAKGGEGIVLKHSRATYIPGRPSSGGMALKYKFVATASVIVAGPHGVKRSVDIKLADGTALGSVTIPPNKEIPVAGQVIEVRYLYAFRGGSVIQPVFLNVRHDIPAEECTADQLQYKGESR